MKRVLSGLKPTGDATLGNYLGAFKRWVELSRAEDAETEQFYFIPNLHALTIRPDPTTLRRDATSMAAWILAAGLDTSRATMFMQSQVPAHSQMAWIFNNYVTMGELNRMTQFKDKSQKGGSEGQLVGMFTYPALMAADILLYDADEVPVGEDQRQHVELARDIASRFNNLYGKTFTLPVATLPESAARIMNLQDPASKMSKSDEDNSGTIMMADTPDEIRTKFKRAVTDSGSEVKAAADKPAISNLLEIMSATTGEATAELEQRFKSVGYGEFKEAVAEAVIEHIEPIRQRHIELMNDDVKLMALLEEGRDKAAAIADEKLASVKQLLGLL